VSAVDPRSLLLITLASCRYDTFLSADAPHLKAIGSEIHRAQAPSHFTYASHLAMWVGATPGIAGRAEPYLNPKFAKFFRVSNGARRAYGPSAFELEGRNIVHGFRLAGYRTIGAGALGWFDPQTPASAALVADFERVFHHGWPWSVERQIAWLQAELDAAPTGKPVFAFLNVGETRAPYWFDGAAWPAGDNPCLPFQTVDRRGECAERQRACLEHVDAKLAPLLARFAAASILATADHGDCWGEDGLWEHGVSHTATLTVPLVFRMEPAIDRARAQLHAAEVAYDLSTEARSQAVSPAHADDIPDIPVTLTTVVGLSKHVAYTEVDGKAVVVDPVAGFYYAFDATGSCILRVLREDIPVSEIVAALTRVYAIDPEACAAEVLTFLQALDEARLLSKKLRVEARAG
jgi:hypothetical protein